MLARKHAIRAMRRAGTGSILTISSRPGLVGTPGAAAYAAADPDTSNEAAKSTKLPGGKKPSKTPKPLECPMEETGREICRDNGFGDQICEPEKVERCPLPL